MNNTEINYYKQIIALESFREECKTLYTSASIKYVLDAYIKVLKGGGNLDNNFKERVLFKVNQ